MVRTRNRARPGEALSSRDGALRRAPWRDASGLGLIEVMIALTIFAVGMLAVAGLSLAVGAQTNWSLWQTDQSLVAQEALETLQRQGYDAATNGTDTVTAGTRRYLVQRTVTQLAPRVKEVTVTVTKMTGDGRGSPPRSFVTRLYEPRPLPARP